MAKMKLNLGFGGVIETTNFQMLYGEDEILFSTVDDELKIGIVKDDEPCENYTTITWYVFMNGRLIETYLNQPIEDI